MAEENQSPLAPYATPTADLVEESKNPTADPALISALAGTRGPTMICAVVCFMATLLTLLLTFQGAMLDGSIFVISGVITAAFFGGAFTILKFSNAISKALQSQTIEDLTKAINCQRVVWTYLSILAFIWGLCLFFGLIALLLNL